MFDTYGAYITHVESLTQTDYSFRPSGTSATPNPWISAGYP